MRPAYGGTFRPAFSRTAFQFLAVLLAGWLLAAVVSTFRVSLMLGAAFALAYLLLFLVRPEWGLLVLVLIRASADLVLGYVPVIGAGGQVVGSLLNIALVLILTFAGLVYIVSRSVSMINLPGGRLLSLLLVVGLVGAIRSNDFLSAMNAWVPVLASFVVYALAAHLFQSPRQVQHVVNVIAASFVLPAAFGLYQLLTGGGNVPANLGVARIIGTFVHPNSFGFFLVLMIALLLGQALFHVGRRRAIAAAGLLLAFALLIGTFARVAWAGTLVVLVTVGILRARILLLSLPIGAFIILRLVPSIGVRLSDPLASGGSAADRLYRLWPATWKAWLSATGAEGGGFLVVLNRLGGVGPGVGSVVFAFPGIPHNDYLRVIVEYGVFGLALYFGLIGVLVVLAFRAWRKFRETNRPAAAVALSFLAIALAFPVMSITDNVFAHTANQLYFWTLAGITVAMRKWRPQHSQHMPLSGERPTARSPNGSSHGTLTLVCLMALAALQQPTVA